MVVVGCEQARAQSDWVTGYLQTVPLYTGSTTLQDSNISSFNRFRLTTRPVIGQVAVEAAYEHAASFRRLRIIGGPAVGVVPSGGQWLKLQWDVADNEHVLWQHRFDRLHVGWSPTRGVELSAGRQAVSWGTTLFLTPADPFVPFSPADPFREFRAGIDAARLRLSPTPLSEIDIVVRGTKTDGLGEELSALVRGLITVSNWEISGWGGALYGDAVGSMAAAGAIGAWAVRGEAVIRKINADLKFRGSVGVDRLLQVNRRDLTLLVEYQRDGLGGARPEEYLSVVTSDPFARGELQVVGRDETILQGAYQVHPLWNIAGLWLWNLNDRSALLSPSVLYSVSDESVLAGGVFFGIGADENTPARPLPSEYGMAGTTGYVSLSWFF